MRQFPGPPLWAEWLLQRVLSSERRDDIIGDLREEYVEAKLPEHLAAGVRIGGMCGRLPE